MGGADSKPYESNASGRAKALRGAKMKEIREKFPHCEQLSIACGGEDDLSCLAEVYKKLRESSNSGTLPFWLQAHMLWNNDALLATFCQQCTALQAPNVRFDVASTPTFETLDAALAGPHLKQLVLENTNGCRGMAHVLNSVFLKSPNITALTLHLSSYDKNSTQLAIEAALTHLPLLEVLQLEAINGDKVKDIDIAFSIRRSIGVITKKNGDSPTTGGGTSKKTNFSSCLRSVTLSGPSVGDDTIAAIMSDSSEGVLFSPKTSLAHVDLSGAGEVSLEKYRALLTTFLQPATTTGLGLPFSLRGSVSGVDNGIHKILAAYKQLAFLNISQLELPAADVIALIKDTLNPAVLQNLDMSYNAALDNTVLPILLSKRFKALSRLAASHTNMTDAALIKALVESVDSTLRQASFAEAVTAGKEREALSKSGRCTFV